MRYLLTTILSIILLCFVNNSQAQFNIIHILQDKIPINYKGKAIDAYRYSDTSGTHIFLITKHIDSINHKTAITATNYTITRGNYVKDWEIRDFADEILLYYKYSKIIDLDKDGLFETVFVYQLNPDHGEGSDWKIMLHYKNKKYVLRAHIPELDFDKYSVKMDDSFKMIPSIIKSYVEKYWNTIIKEQQLKTK